MTQGGHSAPIQSPRRQPRSAFPVPACAARSTACRARRRCRRARPSSKRRRATSARPSAKRASACRAIFMSSGYILPRDSGGGGPREAWWRGAGSAAPPTIQEVGGGDAFESSATATKRRVRRPSHHASRGPPSPLPRGGKVAITQSQRTCRTHRPRPAASGRNWPGAHDRHNQ
jgi:hypothetical protein